MVHWGRGLETLTNMFYMSLSLDSVGSVVKIYT